MGPIASTGGSAPFAAGVAALIWAGGSHLNADQVEMVLRSTAHVGTDPLAPIYVNAIGGIRAVLGDVGPTESLSLPVHLFAVPK